MTTETIPAIARPMLDDALETAIANRRRPPRASALSASITFGWRALLKIKHVPEQFLDVTMFPVMFTLMFTYLFGGALAGSTEEYLQFLLPGILVQTVVMITMYTGVGVNTDVTKGIYDRFRSLPIWQPAAIAGALLGDAARYTIAATVVIVLGLILGYRPDGGVPGVVLSVMLVVAFSFSLSWVWMVLAMFLRTPNSVTSVSMMIMFPLTFITNIFVDPSTMPGWLEAVVDVNPISHLVTSVRGLMDGDMAGGHMLAVAAACIVLNAVFAPITMHLYRNKN